MAEDVLVFASREAFRAWLAGDGGDSQGVWLLFGKAGGPKTLKAGEALEEALCFGWIDGQMQRLDALAYKKYFAPRREKSRWSAKNRALAEKLEAQGLMTDRGRQKIEEAKADGRWDAPDPMAEVGEEQVAQVAGLLQGQEPAFRNFQAMPLSARKTYARAYFDAKTQAGRAKRLAWLVDRLNQNLRPMERPHTPKTSL
ncbi:YdeI/OmpD-associated family protein [Acutalibacter caecimuris]|uniref:YdeI/OmpD-associated family protein n=1 Tax=Acutalibacter caecimuris TaxID=3093657 RepID=UPI002AC98794|nr:YdeI/OmpD-associated family protein [Acutalibacter sp. M00118]